MTFKIEPSSENKLQRAPTEEEFLIDSILHSLEQVNQKPNDKALLENIKNDLTILKSKVTESDFTVRFLKNREKAFQQFIDQFPSMLGYWNKDLVNVHCNQIYADYFGRAPEEIRGKTIRDLLGEKIFHLNLPYIKAVLNGDPQTFERDIPTPAGVKRTLANYLPHVIGDDVAGFFVIVTDISSITKLQERNRELESSLYEQSRLSSLGQMASGIAHEINNPMTIIYSNACLLIQELKKNNYNKDHVIERITEIEKTAERIEKIIDGLRTLASGSREIKREVCDLTEIIEQVLSICRGRFLKAGMKLSLKNKSYKQYVLCNHVQISEIILNILNNAFDSLKNQTDGVVNIEIVEEMNTYKLHISNNGPVIKMEVRDKLFLPFFTTKGKEGTGLGLKISKDLALANGGSLVLSDSEKTDFILTLEKSSS